MDQSVPLSTSTAAPAVLSRPWKGAGVLDSVRVSDDSFSSLLYMGSAQRKEFTTDRRPNSEKPQKRSGDGVPLWSLQLAAVNWRGTPTMLTVTVPAHEDPAGKFTAGEPVELVGLVFGVTPKRDGGGFVTWCSADGIASATGRKHSAPGAAAA